jgi:nicotinamide-nucleotide amidase
MLNNNIRKAEKLVSLLSEKGFKVSFAESCTGGLLGATLTSVSGASAVFDGSLVSYANEVKNQKLGVDKSVLSTVGAVSEECARQMALGACKMFSSDCAAAITGIAGPSGGSAEKPVGLVWFGVASKFDSRTEKMIFPGDRDSVRGSAIEHALCLLLAAAEDM